MKFFFNFTKFQNLGDQKILSCGENVFGQLGNDIKSVEQLFFSQFTYDTANDIDFSLTKFQLSDATFIITTQPPKKNPLRIILGTVFAFLFLVVIAILLFFFFKKRRNSPPDRYVLEERRLDEFTPCKNCSKKNFFSLF